tara:strand:- start:281 stop:1279 length:999 start_codon:yes stop_codon:yes gene_type:complete
MKDTSLDFHSHENCFAPEGKFLWDSWFLNTKAGVHAFYLCSPREGDPEDRHHNGVSIGHAFSSDLYDWVDLGLALKPGLDKSDFDSLSLWTGDIFEWNNRYYLFYTGRRESEFWVQRIGLAISDDLEEFSKVSDLCLQADPTHYDIGTELNNLNFPPAFRDPCIMKDPKTDEFIMVFAARHKGSVKNIYNGCIGWAKSHDLINWQQQEPLLVPGGIDQLETPQLFYYGDYYYLLFSTWSRAFSKDCKYIAGSGLYGFRCKELGTIWEPINGNGQILANGETLYDVRMVCNRQDNLIALGWLNYDRKGKFVGKLSRPIPFKINDSTLKPIYHS